MSAPVVKNNIHTIDLNFMGLSGAIAVYLIPHRDGAILVECGPGSTFPRLEQAIQEQGYALTDITDVLLTHIHLDHAGAAGRLAQTGSRIHVHPVGAPHLIDPEKLLASAGRIYGDMMGPLWGEFLPVPAENLKVVEDGEVMEIGELQIRAVDTPGHAYHHYAYFYKEVCFSGDIAGVRMRGVRHVRLPMPPPEFNLELWRQSLEKLKNESFQTIAPTHFGLFSDPDWHLRRVGLLRDAYRVKWCCILLNNFLTVDANRRNFARGNTEEHKKEQIEKAQKLLTSLNHIIEKTSRN
jgi:glyoxylase-like metal-dependent hydrolase (beta-lactamase superfamily II)